MERGRGGRGGKRRKRREEGVVGAKGNGVGGGLLCAVRLDDVVFDQGVLGPAVDGEIAVTAGVEGAGVFDGSVVRQ